MLRSTLCVTAIACYCSHDFPFVIGDVLLSEKSNAHNTIFYADFQSPLLGKINKLLAANDHVAAGFSQKVCVIRPDLIFAWSGSLQLAREFAQELHKRTAGPKLTPADLDHFLNAHCNGLGQDLHLVGALRVGLRRHWLWGFNCHTVRYPNLDSLRFAGSGMDNLNEVLGTLSSAQISGGKELIDQGYGFSISFLAALMQYELYTAKNVAAYYGGGYELAGVSGETYAKLGNVSWIFWDIEKKGGSISAIPTKALGMHYSGELLRLRAIDFQDFSDVQIPVAGLLSSSASDFEPKIEPSAIPFGREWLINIFFIREQNGQTKAEYRISKGQPADWLRITQDGTKLSVDFHTSRLSEILRTF